MSENAKIDIENEISKIDIENEISKHWHLDKRVPVATLVAILAQFAALVWMASSMNSRIAALEGYTAELKAARLSERTAVIEAGLIAATTKFDHIDSQLSRLEDKVDRIGDKLGANKQ